MLNLFFDISSNLPGLHTKSTLLHSLVSSLLWRWWVGLSPLSSRLSSLAGHLDWSLRLLNLNLGGLLKFKSQITSIWRSNKWLDTYFWNGQRLLFDRALGQSDALILGVWGSVVLGRCRFLLGAWSGRRLLGALRFVQFHTLSYLL